MRRFSILAIIFYLLCHQLSESSDFHLDRQINSPQFTNQIISINALDNNNVALVKASSNNISITVLSGDNLQNKVNEININDFKNSPIITNEGIFINTGKNIQVKQLINTSGTILNSKVTKSNILFLQNPNRIIVSQKQPCPTLLQVLLSSKSTSTKVYEQGTSCEFQNIGYVDAIQNQSLAYAAGHNIYILSRQSLNLQEKIVQLPKDKYKSYGYIDTSSWENLTTIIVSTDTNLTRQNNNQYLIYRNNNTEKKYSQTNSFFNPTSAIQLIGIDQGISFFNSYFYRWNTLSQKNVVYFDFTYPSDQYLQNMFTISIFYTEQHLVLGDSQTNQVWICKYIHSNNTIIKQKSFKIPEGYEVKPHSGVMTPDDKYMLAIISPSLDSGNLQQSQKYGKLLKYNVGKNEYEILNEQYSNRTNDTKQANCSAFSPISNQHYIVICTSDIVSDDDATDYSLGIKFQQIQLRDINNTIVDRIPIPNLQLHPVRILTQVQWDGVFALQVKSSLQISQDQCQTFFFVVQNSKIVNIGQKITFLSYFQSWASGAYICSMKIIINGPITQDHKYLKIYRISKSQNLTQTKKIAYEYAYKPHSYNFYAQKNVLIIQQKQHPYGCDVYYLSGDEEYKGTFFRQFYETGEEQNIDYIIMNKKSLFYLYTNLQVSDKRPNKVIFNINRTLVSQVVKLITSNIKVANQLHTYIANKQQSIILLIQSTKLHKIIDKKPYNQTEQIQLQPSDDKDIQYYKLTLCTDPRYVMIIYQNNRYGQYYAQIRLISNLKYQLWVYRSKEYIYNADISPSGEIVLSTSNNLQIMRLQPLSPADQYNLELFQLFDVNDLNCMISWGHVKDMRNRSRIIYKKSMDAFTYLYTDIQTDSSNVSILALDLKCLYFATYMKDIDILSIWSISQQDQKIDRLQSSNYPNVSTIKFAKNQIFIQQNQQIIIRDIIPNQNNHKLSNTFSNKFVINHNGSLYADYNTDFWILSILQASDQQQLAVFKPGKNITAISFTPTNFLYVTTFNQSFYMLSPTPCPISYINIQSICTCRGNSTETNNFCQCKKNFQTVEEECICGEQFEFEDQSGLCGCPANTTQVLTSCECNKNFIKNEKMCICPEQFEYNNNLCNCRDNSTQVEGKCLCKQNFIQQNFNCKCPLSFDFDNGLCLCKNGYVSQEKVCIPCSFPCRQCVQSGNNCLNYRASFYALIIVSCVVFLLISGIVGFWIFKGKRSKKSIDQMLEEHDLAKYNLLVETEKKS